MLFRKCSTWSRSRYHRVTFLSTLQSTVGLVVAGLAINLLVINCLSYVGMPNPLAIALNSSRENYGMVRKQIRYACKSRGPPQVPGTHLYSIPWGFMVFNKDILLGVEFVKCLAAHNSHHYSNYIDTGLQIMSLPAFGTTSPCAILYRFSSRAVIVPLC